MAMDVCQASLHQTKYREFHLRGKPSEIGRKIQLNTKSATLLQALEVAAKCGPKSEFVQHRRVQKIRRRAYLLAQPLNQIPDFFDRLRQSGRVARRLVFNSRNRHRQSSQILAGAVVQVTGNSPAFLVLSSHQSSGKVAQLIRLLQDLGVSPPQLLRPKLHLSIERVGEGAKTLLALMQFTLDPLAGSDIARYFRGADDFSRGVSDGRNCQ